MCCMGSSRAKVESVTPYRILIMVQGRAVAPQLRVAALGVRSGQIQGVF